MRARLGDMLGRMRCISLPMLLVSLAVHAETPTESAPRAPAAEPTHAGVVRIGAEQWARGRGGEALARLPALDWLIETFERQPQGVIVVRHAGGDASAARAEDLRAALVALGMPSARVRLEVAPIAPEAMELEVRAAGGRE